MSNDILKVIPTLHSAALLHDNVKFLDKKKKKSKDYIKQGVKNVVGTSLIKAESDFLWS